MIKTGIQLINEERQRQIEQKGFSIENDTIYNNNELIDAALCYATPSSHRQYYSNSEKLIGWPFDYKYWKPTPDNRIKELQKAGALIAAEIDRLLNIENK